MPEPSPADELRAAALSTPPCQHPGCGCCEGWHKEDADGTTMCTGCAYDAHRYVNPGYPMPDSMGPLLADWLEAVAAHLEATAHPGWHSTVAPHAFAIARAINSKEQG